jgi:uncharacterized protein (DUF697 family)
MNRPSLLHIVERLEDLLGKLPETIRKPILHELTPLKELFLQQRPPRFAFTGPNRTSVQEIVRMLFALPEAEIGETLTKSRDWQDVLLDDRGTISILDVRGTDFSSKIDLPPDIIFFLDGGDSARGHRKIDTHNLAGFDAEAKVIALAFPPARRTAGNSTERDESTATRLQSVLEPTVGDRFLRVFNFPPKQPQELMSILARSVPNEARIEMIRISRDREAQHEVAQILVKSTAAVCTAIGAQPIPLADLPILTTLQLVMVSGIMYVSGRERSLRAATEFIGALGANVGIGMLFREGTRALLKFFPGWGNVICGMVAGAGTYAIGRAATVFFLEGVSLKDARRVYLTSRKKRVRPAIEVPKQPRKAAKRRK